MRKIVKEARESGILNDKSIDGMPDYGETSNFHPIHLLVPVIIILIALGIWAFGSA